MSDHLDMSLDQIIRKNKNRKTVDSYFNPSRRRTDGSVQGPGPDRRVNHFRPVKPQPYPMPMLGREEQKFMLMPVQGFGGVSGSSGTKLYVSNLDCGVSNGDIKLLFSEVGELMRYSIHYDKSGRSKGTAEVVYARHADAVAAIERYNNNNLDGKPMKIEIVGAEALVCTPMPSNSATNITYHPNFYYASDQQSIGIRAHTGFGIDRGGRHGRDWGQRHQKQNDKKVITAEELNADLEKFLAEAGGRNNVATGF